MHKSASTDICPISCYVSSFNIKFKGRNKKYNSKKKTSLSNNSMGKFGSIFCAIGTGSNIFMISTFYIVIMYIPREKLALPQYCGHF
jgi:hypothetical protein